MEGLLLGWIEALSGKYYIQVLLYSWMSSGQRLFLIKKLCLKHPDSHCTNSIKARTNVDVRGAVYNTHTHKHTHTHTRTHKVIFCATSPSSGITEWASSFWEIDAAVQTLLQLWVMWCHSVGNDNHSFTCTYKLWLTHTQSQSVKLCVLLLYFVSNFTLKTWVKVWNWTWQRSRWHLQF